MATEQFPTICFLIENKTLNLTGFPAISKKGLS